MMLFGGRGKLSKKDLAKNMKAMLAKTKVASSVTTEACTIMTGPSSAAHPKKKPTNSRPIPQAPSSKPLKPAASAKKLPEPQKSIYKPQLKRNDSSSRANLRSDSKSKMSKVPTANVKKTPSSSAVTGRKMEQEARKSTASIYKPPTLPPKKKDAEKEAK